MLTGVVNDNDDDDDDEVAPERRQVGWKWGPRKTVTGITL